MSAAIVLLKPIFGATITDCSGNNCDVNLPHVQATSVQFAQIMQIILGIVGAVAVLVLILAALKFITAQGNPQETAKARNTIVFAAVGIAVIASAEAIIAFALGHL
jgi:hypothetical protein